MKNILEEINSRLGDKEEYPCDQEESWKLSSQKSKIKKKKLENETILSDIGVISSLPTFTYKAPRRRREKN